MTIRFRPLAALATLLAALHAPLALASPPASATIASAAEAEVVPARPALWKVADEDTTIYLFGTIHALPADVEWFGGAVAEAFESAEMLVTEIPEQDPGAVSKALLAHASLPEGENLRDLLSPEERTSYEAAMTTLGLQEGALDRYKPWYAAVTLSLLPLLRDGFTREHGVETALGARATEHDVKRGALETVEFQLALFDSLPLDVQTRYLARVIESLSTLQVDLRAMVEAWRRGDAEELARLINAEEEDPALIEALLTNRNKTWAEWIGSRLDSPGTVFLAVGAGHLAGPGSLQDQLAAAGIASTRVQ